MDAETPTDWAGTSTPEIANETWPHKHIARENGGNNNFYKNLLPTATRGQTNRGATKNGRIIRMDRVLKGASVPLNQDKSSERFEHCSARVPIQPRVQQKSSEIICQMEAESTSKQRVYRFTQVIRWNKLQKNEQNF